MFTVKQNKTVNQNQTDFLRTKYKLQSNFVTPRAVSTLNKQYCTRPTGTP